MSVAARSGLAALVLAALVPGCREGVGPGAPYALLVPDSMVVVEGDSVVLTSALVDQFGDTIPAEPPVWASQDTTVASVSRSGVVRFGRPGRTTVAALSEGRTARVTVIAAVRYVQMSAGPNFGRFVRWCGVTERGSAYCYPAGWQVAQPPESLVALPLPTGAVLREIAVGGEHACALSTDDWAFCWGSNLYGQLGSDSALGPGPTVWAPVAVQGGLRFRSISAGAEHTCALTASGTAYCWGHREDGRLGDGDSTRLWSIETTPVPVAGGVLFRSVAAGTGHTCGVSTNGILFCWGLNYSGQLGLGRFPPTSSSVPLVAAGATRYLSVSSGDSYSCALAEDGTAQCWGANRYGMLGRPDDTVCVPAEYYHPRICNLSPLPVSGSLSFSSVEAGTSESAAYGGMGLTCGLAVTGAAYCWGKGAIGDGVGGSRSTPTAVAGDLAFRAISTGDMHACGLTKHGLVYCWGMYFGDAPQRLPYQP